MAHLANYTCERYYTCERCGGTGQQEAGMPCPLGWGYSDQAGTCDRCKGLGILGDIQATMETNLADIDSLQAGRELDALVHVYVLGGNPEDCFFRDGAPRAYWGNSTGPDEDTFYSTNIALVWLVAERIPRFGIQRNPDGSFTAGQKDAWHMLYWEECADAETAPLAICRAALKVIKTAWERAKE